MRILMAITIVVCLTVCGIIAAQAQTAPQGGARMPCYSAPEVAKQLANKYKEAPIAFGLQSNGNLLQVYASEAKGSWTVVSTSPNGMSCIVAAGKQWERKPEGPMV